MNEEKKHKIETGYETELVVVVINKQNRNERNKEDEV
jgi:hypothetical protein